MKISATQAVSKFKCLQADCPDTCCKGWSMQLDDQAFEKYKNSELEQAVSYDGDIRVMKRDPKTDFCVKFEGGICSIHKNYGEAFLGDACNFYPRVTRNLGEDTIMTLTPSCPEALRLMLEPGGSDYISMEVERVPSAIKDWLGQGDMDAAGAQKVHRRFLVECTEGISAARLVARIYSVSSSLKYIDKKDWPDATDFMFRMADGRLQKPETSDTDDYNVLQLFLGIVHATRKNRTERLEAVISAIAQRLNVTVDYANIMLHVNGHPRPGHKVDDELLKKYISSSLSFNLYPFAGVGNDIAQKANILAFRFSLMRLALESWHGKLEDCIQPLARIIDHIGDATLMLNLMDGFGWSSESRLLGLLRLND